MASKMRMYRITIFLCIIVSLVFITITMLSKSISPYNARKSIIPSNTIILPNISIPSHTSNVTNFAIPSNVITTSIEGKHFHMWIHKDQQLLVWCGTVQYAGLGNRISQYWLSRTLAFWLNLTFAIDEQCICNSEEYRHYPHYFCPMNQNKTNVKYWTQFLPIQSNLTLECLVDMALNHCQFIDFEYTRILNDESFNFKSENQKTKYIEYSHYIKQQYLKTKKWYQTRNKLYKLTTPHAAPLFQAVINSLFVKIVQYEMERAFDLFYNERFNVESIMNEYNLLQTSLANMNTNVTHVIIHWRCGDLLSGISSRSYGFNGVSYYRDAYQTWKSLHLLKEDDRVSLHILSNLNPNKARELDKYYVAKCIDLLALISGAIKQIFNVNEINIIGNGSINHDYYLLSQSKFVICAISSFCDLAAFGNKHNVIVRDRPRWNLSDDRYFPSDNIKTLLVYHRKIHVSSNHTNISDIAQFIISH
eukprot:270734_1